MMREKTSFRIGSAVGASSLLTIFAVLCLTVFALLSLNTAAADGRLSRLSAEAAADYYAAELEAEEILARLRAGELPEGVSYEEGVYRYSCRISDRQLLEMTVRQKDGDYTVLRRQSVPVGEWMPEDGPGVWDGTE